MTTKPKPCPLCGSTEDMTDEDILPLWLREWVKEKGGFDPANDQWPAKHKLRMCTRCNGRLNQALETDALRELVKPLVVGEPVSLSGQSQALLTRWITKTALLDLIKRRDTPEDLRQWYAELVNLVITTPRVTDHFSVRLFWLPEASHPSSGQCLDSLSVSAPVSSGPYWVTWIGCWGVEWLLEGEEQVIRRHVSLSSAENHAVRVWPYLGARTWPPERGVTDDYMLALRFAHKELRNLQGEPTTYEWAYSDKDRRFQKGLVIPYGSVRPGQPEPEEGSGSPPPN